MKVHWCTYRLVSRGSFFGHNNVIFKRTIPDESKMGLGWVFKKFSFYEELRMIPLDPIYITNIDQYQIYNIVFQKREENVLGNVVEVHG